MGKLNIFQQLVLGWWQLFNRKRYDIYEYQLSSGMFEQFAFDLAYNHKF